MSVPDDPGDNTFCMLLTTIGAASLAIWLYLLLARGGSGGCAPTSWLRELSA